MQGVKLILILCVVALARMDAQSLARRVAASDGIVQVIYPSRATACGDGEQVISGVLGSGPSVYTTGNATYSANERWPRRPCVHGPARLLATVVGGEVTRLRAFVGPVPDARPDTRSIDATAEDATGWLANIVARSTSRSASDAILPLVIAEGSNPWPLLVRVARDENRPGNVRRAAIEWLSRGVTDHLGLDDAEDRTDDDQMRSQAVFVLSQRPKSESVPDLIDLARSAIHASVRRSAIFWLGQTGDSRAIDVYAELLGLR